LNSYPSDDVFNRLAKYTGKELFMLGKKTGGIADNPANLDILFSGKDVYSFIERVLNYSFAYFEVALNSDLGKGDQIFIKMVLGLAKIITSYPIGLYVETMEPEELVELDDKARKVIEKFQAVAGSKKN
jgi:hypothetical protein